MKFGIAHPLQNDTSGAALVVMVGVAGIAWWFWHLTGPARDSFLKITGAPAGSGGAGGTINPFGAGYGTAPIAPGTPIPKGNGGELPPGIYTGPISNTPPFGPIKGLF